MLNATVNLANDVTSIQPTQHVGVLLIDDHPMTRFGVRHAIEREAGLRLLGEAELPEAGLAMAETLHPDVVVADLVFPGTSGLDLIKDVRIRCPRSRIVVYSAMEGMRYAEQCVRIGASGYVCKSDPNEHLIRAIRAAAAGRVYVSEDRAGDLLARLTNRPDDAGKSPVDRLSNGEFAVLHLIAQGLSNQEIAQALNRSVKTVETYRSRIKRKVGVTSATQLAQFATDQLRRHVAPTNGDASRVGGQHADGEHADGRDGPAPIVLLVEDHVAIRDPLVKLMRHRGYDVREACDGVQAMAALEAGKVDVMVLDLMIPRVSGVELLGQIHGDGRWADMPVIVVTGSADGQMLRKAGEYTQHILAKASFRTDELLARIDEVLHR